MSDERIHSVRTTGSWLRVRLTDGRECVVPLKWYPRLYGAKRGPEKSSRPRANP